MYSRISLASELVSYVRAKKTCPRTCAQCGKVLKDEHTLRCHLKTVHGEKKFACPECGKKFPHAGVLNAHQKTHSDTLYTCDTCQEKFRDLTYFKKHVRSHSGQRPHPCPVCDRSYMQMSHLTDHLSIHSQAQPFACDVCPKRFRLAASLKEHKNRHNNVKSHSCPDCSYSTCYRKNLTAHLKTHSNTKRSGRDTATDTSRPGANLEAPPFCSSSLPSSDKETRLQIQRDGPVFLLVNLAHKGGLDSPPVEEEIFCIEEATTSLADGRHQPIRESVVDAIADFPVFIEAAADGPQLPLSAIKLSAFLKGAHDDGEELLVAASAPTLTSQRSSGLGRRHSDIRPLDLSLGQPTRIEEVEGQQENLALSLRDGE